MAIKEIKIPDIGGATDVDVIEVLVNVGDTIAAEDSLITLESDKASMEVPAPFGGVVKELKVKVGDKVSEGDLILTVEAEGEAKPAAEAKSKEQTPVVEKAQEKPAATAAATTQQINVIVPDIGGATDVDVIEVMVNPGDEIAVDDSIITLESDKASMEVPSSHAGVVKEIKVKVGDKVSQGNVILVLESKEAAPAEPQKTQTTAPAAAPAPAVKTTEPVAQTSTAPSIAQQVESYSDVYAGPGVRRLAFELGVDLRKVTGTGRKGRILQTDIHKFVKSVMQGQGGAVTGAGLAVAPAPKIDFSKFGEVETKPLSKIKRLTGQNVHRSWVTVPHVTQFDEADITEMEAFRQAHKKEAAELGFKLTPIVFIMKAIVACLKQFPSFNASLDETGENLIMKKYFHIGVAADTPNGLVVPVIRDADKKGLYQLADELVKLSNKARDKGLSLTDMQGACFTISSLGGIGGTAFTPIVNSPEVAILGLSRSVMKPVYKNGEFVPRLMLPLSLSYDHRVIDGAEAARFTTYLAKILGDVRQLLL